VIYVLYFIHVVVCLFLILVVLLQQGKGADLSVFGGGSTMAAFGARGAATLLHKLTVGSFIVFTLTTLAIAIFQGRPGSVVSGVDEEAPAASAPLEPASTAPVAVPPVPADLTAAPPAGESTTPPPVETTAPAAETTAPPPPPPGA
jgi:preprotein translocase subunit SecG